MLCIVLALASCSKKKEQKPVYSLQPKMALSARDTTAVMNLTTEFLNHLQSREIDQAMSMLYYLTKDKKVIPLPDSLAVKQRSVFRLFPVLSYKIIGIIFYTETDSQVKYQIEFFKKKPGDNTPNTIDCFIKPMRVAGVWKLTMYDSNNQIGTSAIEN